MLYKHSDNGHESQSSGCRQFETELPLSKSHWLRQVHNQFINYIQEQS